MKCPNKSSKEWISLVNKLGINKAFDEYIKNGEDIPNPDNYNDEYTGINAGLKIFNALTEPKAVQLYNKFYKNNKDKFYLELIPLAGKDQVELLKEYNYTNNPNSLQDMILGISSEMGYTIEINTAKESYLGNEWQIEQVDEGYDAVNKYTKERKFFIELDDAYTFIGDNKILNAPTQHYSNLTVNEDFYKNNSDWEYKEQRIVTPLITPYIKGHPQFAESNDIGWFRAWYNKKTGEVHVLEIQSDLYQKSRDIKSPDEIIAELQKEGKLKIDCN